MPWKDPEEKRKYDRAWEEAHPGRQKAYQDKYYDTHREQLKKKEKKRTSELWRQILEAYGARCACPGCDESNPKFLSVDHKFNDGAQHRRELYGNRKGCGSTTFHRWLKKAGFPQDRFQLLCFNCNLGKQRNGGTCPHEDPH